jgi:hypothetical protein
MALYFDGANASYTAQISKQLTTNWGPVGAVTPELPGNIVPYVESYEVKGHLTIRETQRALDLMRRSWGWYLNNPYGTESTILEGYYEDGSFRYANDGYDYSGSYPSHAHGWSSGPADALISYVVGLRPTAPGGSKWTLAPQFGDSLRPGSCSRGATHSDMIFQRKAQEHWYCRLAQDNRGSVGTGESMPTALLMRRPV